MRKLFRVGLTVLWAIAVVAAATPQWQNGRIVDVKKNVNTKTLYWLVNTPITQDEISYTISVQASDRIYIGSYEISKQYGPPPEGWTKNRPVRAELDGDTVLLAGAPGENVRMHLTKQKAATAAMQPLSKEELAGLGATASGGDDAQSLIGFDKPAEKQAPPVTQPPSSSAQQIPVSAQPAMGSLAVSTTPYLAEIYVDGNDMGYSPAKINLPPGKHSVRLEKDGYKAWVKDITMTSGSELNLAATLDKK